jgi:glutathionylspermidine synthase
MNDFFTVKKFSKDEKDLLKSLKNVIGEDLKFDLSSFPVPLGYITIKNNYYLSLSQSLIDFNCILEKIFFEIIKKKFFSKFNLKHWECKLLESYKKSNYISPLLRFDCALTKTGPKVMEINARHPFGPGSFALGHRLVLENCDHNENYLHFDLEKDIFEKIKKLTRTNHPTAALVYQTGTISEIEIQEIGALSKMINHWGIRSMVAPIHALAFTRDQLYIDNHKIDILYRWFEFQKISEQLREKIYQVYQNRKFILMNDFSSIILGNKNLLALISHGDFDYLLKQEEKNICRKLLPKTYQLDEMIADMVGDNQDRFLIKKARGTEGKDIIFGKELSQKEWKNKIDFFQHQNYIAQEFIDLPVIDFNYYLDGKVYNKKVFWDFDPYIVDNKISGYISRVSTNYITNYNAGGMLIPVLIGRKA